MAKMPVCGPRHGRANATDMSLEQSFLDLLRALPGAESIDADGMLPVEYRGKRADFALFGRSLIVEVKSLQADPSHRVQTIVDEYRDRPGFPLFYGQLPLAQVVANMPSAWREEIRRRVALDVTKAVAKALAQANRQIRESKIALNVQEAGGLLVLLNDEVPILSPNLLVYSIQRQLKIRRPDESYRFSALDWVMAILKSHELQAEDGTWAHPILLLQGPPTDNSERIAAFADYIREQWAHVEGARQIESKGSAELLEGYRVTKNQ